MSRTIKAVIAVVLVLIISFSAISICQNIGRAVKIDVTEQKLYTLSDGTKAILAKLNQPLKLKLYYSKTAALKAPDQIRFFNNYYRFVEALLVEYAEQAGGMIDLEVIDPRPYSDEEVQALRYGLRRFAITEEESFFFGLVVQTQFGVEKSIEFFSPDRQKFVEYDISYLIDTAITRQKKRIGILSSLDVMGDQTSDYMAQLLRMQGQRPKPAWGFVEQLRNQYEVTGFPADADEIKDVDILLVVHPKELAEKTIFAIDQFVLKGGRTIVCVDPYCFADKSGQTAMQMRTSPSQSSNVPSLLQSWGLEMAENTFAGDKTLALKATLRPNQRPEKIIGFLSLNQSCFNSDAVITAQLNNIRVLFAGVLEQIEEPNSGGVGPAIERTPLIMTSSRGNSFSVSSQYEMMALDATRLMRKFYAGSKPVVMGYLVTGRFKSAFPDGIDIEVENGEQQNGEKSQDLDEGRKETRHITGLVEAAEDCAVVVFSDVDFISDLIAYQDTFFGKIVVADNSALLLNTVDELCGSTDLISIRSRGNFRRPFTVVDEIEKLAEAETAEEEAKINAEIAGFQSELQSILASAKKGEEEVIGSTILDKKKQLELKIHQARRQLRHVKMKRRQRIEYLGNVLRNFNMLMAPAVILVIAVVLGIRRSIRKRHYISHASDA